MELCINNKKIKLVEAKSFTQRLLGLMFKKKFTYGMYFKNCHSIHTFFMKESIDIIMTDKNSQVIYIYTNLSKNKIIRKKEAQNVIELPANTINNIYINDTLEIK